MLRDGHTTQYPNYTKTPNGFGTDLFEVCYRRPDFASSNPISDGLFKSIRWARRRRGEPTNFLAFNSIKRNRHVSCLNTSPLSSHRCIEMNRRREELEDHLYILLSYPTIFTASSGQPSPQSSIASFIFSPSDSSSSESSQDSSTDSPTYPAHLIRRQPRIQVSSLLADPFTRTYHLEIIQHPQKTAEFGHSSLSRLPLTPPIIARLTVRDSSGNSVVPEAELPFLIAHLSLFSDDGLTALDMGSSIGRGHTPPLLYGNLVSSIDQLEDLQGNMGLFFVFPDVSIRWRGRFQLGIAVMRISRSDPSGGMGIADQGMVLAEARTRSFDVLPYPQYTAVPRTRLTTSFLRQGARMFTFMSQNI